MPDFGIALSISGNFHAGSMLTPFPEGIQLVVKLKLKINDQHETRSSILECAIKRYVWH